MTLFEPVTLGTLSIRNRIMMSPMSQRAAGQDGRAGDWHLVHYGSRAVGGCGLVMIEDTAVGPLGRTGHAALGLYHPRQVEPLRRIARFCHLQGASVGIQLAHAGRRALAETRGAPGILSASPIAYADGWTAPREAGADELAGVVAAFGAAGSLALAAEIDVLEVHAAHGYLIHQFLSPLSNCRADAYGRDGVGRRRLLVEVVRAVRAHWPAGRPLFVRLPAVGELAGNGVSTANEDSTWTEGSRTEGSTGRLERDELLACARECLQAGADLIDLTGGVSLLGGRILGREQVLASAAALTAEVELPLALGGGVLDVSDAEGVLQEHGAALVSVGRPLLDDPYWPRHAIRELV